MKKLLIASIIFLFLAIGLRMIFSTMGDHNQTTNQTLRRDSAILANIPVRIAKSEAIEIRYSNQAKIVKKEIELEVAKTEKIADRYVPESKVCDTLLMKYKYINNLLRYQAQVDSMIIDELRVQLLLKDTAIHVLNEDLEIYKDKLIVAKEKTKRNWVERNAGILGFVIGAALFFHK